MLQKTGTYTAENGDLSCRKWEPMLQKTGTYTAENGDLCCRKRGPILQKMGTYTAENGDLYTLLRYINTDFISHLKEIKNNKSNLKEKKRIEYRKKGLK